MMNFLLAIVSSICLINGVFLSINSVLRVIFIVFGVLGLLWSYFAQLIEQTKLEQEVTVEIVRDVDLLQHKLKQGEFEFPVYEQTGNWVWIWLGITCLSFFIGALVFGFSVLSLVFFLMKTTHKNSRPVIVFTANGLVLPDDGILNWADLDSIEMQRVSFRLSSIGMWVFVLNAKLQFGLDIKKKFSFCLYSPTVRPELIVLLAEKMRSEVGFVSVST